VLTNCEDWQFIVPARHSHCEDWQYIVPARHSHCEDWQFIVPACHSHCEDWQYIVSAMGVDPGVMGDASPLEKMWSITYAIYPPSSRPTTG